jgi:hypothetical protein
MMPKSKSAPAISDNSTTAAATDVSSTIVPRLYFKPGRAT